MLEYDVRFLSTQDLRDLQNDFIKSNPDREPGSESGSESEPGSGIESETGSFDIYRLLQFLVEDNPNSSFFIDELPFIFEGECYISVSTIVCEVNLKTYLNKTKQIEKHFFNFRLWVWLRFS